jgi:hypothetical protein
MQKRLTCPVLVTSVCDIPPLIFPMVGGGRGAFCHTLQKLLSDKLGISAPWSRQEGCQKGGKDRLLGIEGHKEAKKLYHLEYHQQTSPFEKLLANLFIGF